MLAPRSTKVRRGLFAALATPLALGAVAAGASTAQAHDDTSRVYEWRDTSDCSCWLGDEYDGTEFEYDAGGRAAKARIYSGDVLVGKMEFHPLGEKSWFYDTSANNDTIYYQVEVDGIRGDLFRVPKGDRFTVIDGSLHEGTEITLYAFDDAHPAGYGVNKLAEITGKS